MHEIKLQLAANEIMILVDFSENYGCKYSEEVQSAHFGASKGQVTLHTGVLYLNGLNTVECQQGYGKQKQKCISFCSMSDSLRHDAAAVWAHLLPLLHLVKKQYVQVDTVHFQSDGPTTQYRNKNNFYLFTHFARQFGWKLATWNLSETGHGKGAADGIGGVVKRTADQCVAHGSDITSVDMLIENLKAASLKVHIFKVDQTDIEVVDCYVPKKLKSIPNTMKLHQLVWRSRAPATLELRGLSCTSCTDQLCKHFAMNPATFTFLEARPSATPGTVSAAG